MPYLIPEKSSIERSIMLFCKVSRLKEGEARVQAAGKRSLRPSGEQLQLVS